MFYPVKNILWAADFSTESANALVYAKLFAKTCKARITALHVFPELAPALLEASPMVIEKIYRQAEANRVAARRKIAALGRKKGIRFHDILVESGSPAKKIIEIAGKRKTDLIVMGKRGRSALEKILVGSVANGVLRHSPAPVLIVSKKRLQPRIKKILIPTDFSKREEIERNFAWALAGFFKSDLTLLHVLELYNYQVPPESAEAMLRDIQGRLRRRKTGARMKVKVSEDIIRAINAAAGIVNYAQSKKFDMIAISTYKHTKLARFFLGSNTERVISLSDVPVFAIPADCREE